MGGFQRSAFQNNAFQVDVVVSGGTSSASGGSAGTVGQGARRYSRTPAAYIDVYAQLRRDEARAERERLEAGSLKPPQAPEAKKIVAPFDATLAQLGPTERANEIVAQMQRQAQLAAADLQNIRRKRDDEEAIALLLLS